MTTAKELLLQAGATLEGDTDEDMCEALVVLSLSRMPDYEAAVDALEWLLNHHDYMQRADCDDSKAARAALARLRSEVPA
jgi:hypothetical protein